MACTAFTSSGGGPSHVSLASSSCCAAAGVSYCRQRGSVASPPWHAAAHSAVMKRGLRLHSPAAAHAAHPGLLFGAPWLGFGWFGLGPARLAQHLLGLAHALEVDDMVGGALK